MSQFLFTISVWLHILATVVFIGYFLLLALIYLPAINAVSGDVQGRLISAISKRSRPWLYVSLLIFIVTGSYLTLTDPSYLGLAHFGSPWTILMLIKHLLILGMIGIGFWFNAILRVGPLASSNTGAGQAMAHFRSYVLVMAITGATVLLLTAIAQSQ